MGWNDRWKTDLHASDHILKVFLPSVHNQQLPTKLNIDLHPFDRQYPYSLQLTDIREAPPPTGRASISCPPHCAVSRLTSATAS